MLLKYGRWCSEMNVNLSKDQVGFQPVWCHEGCSFLQLLVLLLLAAFGFFNFTSSMCWFKSVFTFFIWQQFFSFVHSVFHYRCKFFIFFGTGTPFTLNTTLGFCPYNGSTCCSSTQDAQIKKQFQLMNVSDHGCASLLKSILCAVSFFFSKTIFNKEDSEKETNDVYFSLSLPYVIWVVSFDKTSCSHWLLETAT